MSQTRYEGKTTEHSYLCVACEEHQSAKGHDFCDECYTDYIEFMFEEYD
jgi:hypothetical protein